jgi:hypothetical protein
VTQGSGNEDYPPEAYAPNGILWWKLKKYPGKRNYGGERKIAAYLAFNVKIGGTFTMANLRAAIGEDDVPDKAEHLNRRFRRLRQDGWEMPTNKDDASLPVGTYRLDRIGWHPGLGQERPQADNVSQATIRRVLERDGRRCVVCGVGSGEPYPNEPGTRAVLTAGHRKSRDSLGSSKDLNNLQAECKHCNETVREELRDPETLDDLIRDVRRLKSAEKQRLLQWMDLGYRTRDLLDEVHDRARALSPSERNELVERLQGMLGRSALEHRLRQHLDEANRDL